ncbi:hypothetical protein [Methylobacterium sp. WL120]|uniref:hypothetical protein n=1 Tax=Methylobacterium sp. WL120 TaxID=2603887 RepID=UPI0011CAEE74|nr:hypothetical protein [Methylobacterium sp. WL120]TXM69675.1 hypothetical protein FV229_04840 [Methylobacterium sp. WL120]
MNEGDIRVAAYFIGQEVEKMEAETPRMKRGWFEGRETWEARLALHNRRMAVLTEVRDRLQQQIKGFAYGR